MNNPIVRLVVTVGILCVLVLVSEFHAKNFAPSATGNATGYSIKLFNEAIYAA